MPHIDTPVLGTVDRETVHSLTKDRSRKTLRGHTDTVLCVHVSLAKNRIISGGMDKLVNIYDLETHEIVNTLKFHDGWVKCLALDHERIISGSGDKTIRIVTELL
jgi:WD40 repeat protein